MQISEELIRQITSAVLDQMSQTGTSETAHPASSIPSLAGRERINEEHTSYADLPRAKQGTDPKEVVIGVGAAFQKEIQENGQCLFQDLYGRVGVVQIHPVFADLFAAFDTRPPKQREETR